MVFVPALLVGVASLGVGTLLLVRPRAASRLDSGEDPFGPGGYSSLDPSADVVDPRAFTGGAFLLLGAFGVAFGLAPEAVTSAFETL